MCVQKLWWGWVAQAGESKGGRWPIYRPTLLYCTLYTQSGVQAVRCTDSEVYCTVYRQSGAQTVKYTGSEVCTVNCTVFN